MASVQDLLGRRRDAIASLHWSQNLSPPSYLQTPAAASSPYVLDRRETSGGAQRAEGAR